VQVAVLGPLRVQEHDGRTVELGGARLRALLCRLALSANTVVGVDALIDGLWGQAPPAGAVNALQSLVSRLRRALPDGTVESLPAGYRLAAEVDADRFERLVAEGRQAAAQGDPGRAADLLGTSLALWRGEALADVSDAPFAAVPAARLAELRLAATEDRIAADLALGRYAQVVGEVSALAAAHPMRERLHAHLVTALYGAGRQADALAAYERIRRTLVEELGVDPSPELAAAHLAVLQGRPAAAEGRPGTTNLRAALTSFIGRDEELSRVAKSLEDTRLVTLLGPGGAGKTRLAAEVGARVGELLPDGRWMVELAPVTEPAEVPQAVLAALGVRESAVLDRGGELGQGGRDVLARIVGTLAGKRALLILDNAEHLIDAVARLADHVLARCPQLRVLATSREPLGITGEALSVLPPLATPAADVGFPEVMEYAAVRLFADRGNAARAGFAVSEGNVAAVVQVCQRLDGLPLALELAAARLRALPVEQIAARLDDRFRLLTGGSRTALPRHRTLAAVVDWSWELLDAPERAVLRRLSACSAGATLAAAEHICADAGDVPESAVLDLLAALVDKSLVEPTSGSDGEPRYRLLETIRAYGADRLAEAGEADRVREAHAQYFLALAEHAEPHLRGPEQLYWLARMTADNDNLLAALRWSIDTRRAELATRLAAALGSFWLLRGSRTESAAWLAEALSVPGESPPLARAVAGSSLGLSLLGVGRLVEAMEAFTTARQIEQEYGLEGHPSLVLLRPVLALLGERHEDVHDYINRALDDEYVWTRAMSRLLRGHLRANEGDQEGAEADMGLALEEFRESGDRFGRALTTGALAWNRAIRGDNPGASAALVESLGMLSELGAVDEMAEVLSRLALTRARAGDHAGATVDLLEAQALAQRYGGFEAQVTVTAGRADVARMSGELDTALALYREALELMPEEWSRFGQPRAIALSGTGYTHLAAGAPELARAPLAAAVHAAVASQDMPVVADTAQALGALALSTGDPVAAARLLGIAVTLRGAADEGSPDVHRIREGAAAALGGAYADAFEGGAALSRDAALTELLDLAGPEPAL
jgi:predicted ATPase/DNA-binding SARP family transcriptional activator